MIEREPISELRSCQEAMAEQQVNTQKLYIIYCIVEYAWLLGPILAHILMHQQHCLLLSLTLVHHSCYS